VVCRQTWGLWLAVVSVFGVLVGVLVGLCSRIQSGGLCCCDLHCSSVCCSAVVH